MIRTICAVLLLVGMQSGVRAEAVSEDFDGSLSAATWTFLNKPKTADGALILATGDADPQGYLDCGLVSREGNASLNFIEQPLEIRAEDVQISGSAQTDSRILQVIIAADSPKETQAVSYVKLRLSADGRATVTVGGAGSSEKSVISTGFSFPIQKLSLQLDGKEARLSIKTPHGDVKAEGELEGHLDAGAWSGAQPYLIVKATRRPSEGDCKVTLDSLAISPVKE
jgi:hypothetical protein